MRAAHRENQRTRDRCRATRPLAAPPSKPEAPLTPAERVRKMMRQRLGLPGARPTLRD